MRRVKASYPQHIGRRAPKGADAPGRVARVSPDAIWATGGADVFAEDAGWGQPYVRRRPRGQGPPRSVHFRTEIGSVPHRDRFEALPSRGKVRLSRVFSAALRSTALGRPGPISSRNVMPHLRHFECLGRGDPTGMASRLRAAGAGAVPVAHSRALRAGRNPGIMRKRSFNSGPDPAPMCADPPQRTWEPDDRTRQPTGKRMILRETDLRPVAVLLSHVQHRRRPPPPPQPTHHAQGAASDVEDKHRLRCTDTPQSRAGTAPISANPARWLHPAQVGL